MSKLDYGYLDQDLPDNEIMEIIGELPKRWGRMDKLSRLAVVETGRALKAVGLPDSKRGGLIGGTRFGSIATDLAYAETLKQGVEMASPMLFSYTLPNIAIAEAASHYGLTGPVFSLYSSKPLEAACEEARRWLESKQGLDFMVAGELDIYPVSLGGSCVDSKTAPGDLGSIKDVAEIISANFRIVS